MNTKAPFEFEAFYHIYNRTHNKDLLFREERNFDFFLHKYSLYLSAFLNIHAYAFLSNHFHFSVQVKPKEEINQHLSRIPKSKRSPLIKSYLDSEEQEIQIHQLIVRQHQRFFISYSKAYNKVYKRTGGIFQRPFKHSKYDPAKKFKNLQYYIHHNARKHGIVNDFRDYPFTSYHLTFNQSSKLIDTEQIEQHFGTLGNFKNFLNTDQDFHAWLD